jgi:pyruvate ferredoxin oxidoreductase gamma subunit
VIEREVLLEAIAGELAGLGPDIVAKNQAGALAAFDAMADWQGTVAEGVAVAAADYGVPDWIELPLDDARVAAPDIRASANSMEVRTGLWRTMRPVIDYDHCKHCWWVCSTFCPDSAIAVTDDIPVIDYDHCKGCMVCVGVCPPHAIAGIPEYLAQQQDRRQPDTGGADAAETADR